MKTYIITATLSHESFGGYTHNDGHHQIEVKASSKQSAKNKAYKKFAPYEALINGVYTVIEYKKNKAKWGY
jgi:hypothetical protein